MGKKSTTSQSTTNPMAQQVYQTAKAATPQSYGWLNPSQTNTFMQGFNTNVTKPLQDYSATALQSALDANHKQNQLGAVWGDSPVSDDLVRQQYAMNDALAQSQAQYGGYGSSLSAAQTENSAANQYPLIYRALLGQLAQGTQATKTGSVKDSGFGNSLDVYGNFLNSLTAAAKAAGSSGGGGGAS